MSASKRLDVIAPYLSSLASDVINPWAKVANEWLANCVQLKYPGISLAALDHIRNDSATLDVTNDKFAFGVPFIHRTDEVVVVGSITDVSTRGVFFHAQSGQAIPFTATPGGVTSLDQDSLVTIQDFSYRAVASSGAKPAIGGARPYTFSIDDHRAGVAMIPGPLTAGELELNAAVLLGVDPAAVPGSTVCRRAAQALASVHNDNVRCLVAYLRMTTAAVAPRLQSVLPKDFRDVSFSAYNWANGTLYKQISPNRIEAEVATRLMTDSPAAVHLMARLGVDPAAGGTQRGTLASQVAEGASLANKLHALSDVPLAVVDHVLQGDADALNGVSSTGIHVIGERIRVASFAEVARSISVWFGDDRLPANQRQWRVSELAVVAGEDALAVLSREKDGLAAAEGTTDHQFRAIAEYLHWQRALLAATGTGLTPGPIATKGFMWKDLSTAASRWEKEVPAPLRQGPKAISLAAVVVKEGGEAYSTLEQHCPALDISHRRELVHPQMGM